MQPRRRSTALSPLDPARIRLAAGLPIVVVTSHAFVHVQFSLLVRERVKLAGVAFDKQRFASSLPRRGLRSHRATSGARFDFTRQTMSYAIGEMADARTVDISISERRRADSRAARSQPDGSAAPRDAVAGSRCARPHRASQCVHPTRRRACWRVSSPGAACARHPKSLRVVALTFGVGRRIRPPTASLFAVWKKKTFPAAVNLHSRALQAARDVIVARSAAGTSWTRRRPSTGVASSVVLSSASACAASSASCSS